MENMEVNNNNLLKQLYGKRVFVTGHTGFKGTWLISVLNKFNATVKGYSLPPVKGGIFDLINGSDFCENDFANILNYEYFKKSFLDFKPEIILHLAAQPLVIESYHDPKSTFETNILGTVNLLNIIKEYNQKCDVIIITTDKVYENKNWSYPYRENDNIWGHDPYSSSKACTELISDSFNKSFFESNDLIKLATARAGNVIGGGDISKDRLLPDIFNSIENDHEILIRNPNAIRPWQHVIEPIIGYLLLALNLRGISSNISKSYNFGPSTTDHLSVLEVIQHSFKIFNKGKYKIIDNENKFHETEFLRLDNSKANNLLSWKPLYNCSKAIDLTIDWNNAENKRDITNKQIDDYLLKM
jgi:CDP-glucose 4,6-dehydratase